MKRPREGKTKHPIRVENGLIRFRCKDDTTAGNGARHEIIPGKGALVARTIERSARLLLNCGFPVAFVDQDSNNSYLALNLNMIPIEAVARRISDGSMPKRHVDYPQGYRFETPVVEFFLKTSDRVWKTPQGEVIYLPCDDPLLRLDGLMGSVTLFLPNKPFTGIPFETLAYDQVFTCDRVVLGRMIEMTLQSFLVCEKAAALPGGVLGDFKIEFGLRYGKLFIGEPPSFEEWRLAVDGYHLDKEPFRKGEDATATLERFTRAAAFADGFPLVQDTVAKWWQERSRRAA